MSSHRKTQFAHALRRAVHLGNLVLLWIYYSFGEHIAGFLKISLADLVWILLGIILFLEALRLWRGWTIFGQRDYERYCISSLTWGALGSALVLLFAPSKAFAIPIISAYAIGDPLIGEMRRNHFPKPATIIIGLLAIAAVWWLSHIYLNTPAWLILLMPPVTLAAEWPNLKWIDDNALMQLIPLALILWCQLH
jgi:hypothetical protein